MSSVDAGSINSSIRIDLNTLKQDVAKVEKIYDTLDGRVKKNSESVSKQIKIVENAQKQGALSQEEAIKRIITIREKALKQLQDSVTKSGKLTTLQVQEIKKQEAELKDLKKAQDQYTDSLDENSEQLEGNSADLKEMAIQAGLVTLAVTAAKQAITVFGETEQSLANVQAVTNATREEFVLLEEAAIDAGESTRFTANDAADALFFLSSAGLSAQESTDALGTTLELAGATGSDLAETAKTLTSTMSQFGISADEAARISNVFAAANSNSQATVENITNALRQAGPIAGQFGISIEETTANLEALFNAGFKGEQSGTALRNILLTLADSSSKVSKAFVETGGAIEDIDPRVVGITGAIEALKKSGLDLSQVFDKEAVGAVLSLSSASNDTEKGLRALESAVTDTNEASRQYAVQNNTLFGDIDKLKSASEGLGIALTSEVAPALRGLIDIVTNIVKIITDFPTILKTIGIGAVGAATGFTALATALKILGITLGGSLGVVSLIGAAAVSLGVFANKSKEIKENKLAEEFKDLANELGKSDTAMEDFTKKAVKAEQAFQAFAVDRSNFARLSQFVGEISKDLGISEKEVISIGLESKKVSDEYKDQLETLQTQITNQEDQLQIMRDTITIEEAIELSRLNQLSIAERQKQNADNVIAKNRERLNRLEDIKTETIALDKLIASGAISEIDGLNKKKDLRQEEIDLLVDQAQTSGDVTTEVVKGINTQKAKIDEYDSRLEVLGETIEDNAKKEEDTTDITIEEKEKQLKAINEFHDKWNDRQLKQKDDAYELLEDERNKAVNEAEALGQDIQVIEEYYFTEKQKLRAKDNKDNKDKSDKNIEIAKKEATDVIGIVENSVDLLGGLFTDSESSFFDFSSNVAGVVAGATGSVEAEAVSMGLSLWDSLTKTISTMEPDEMGEILGDILADAIDVSINLVKTVFTTDFWGGLWDGMVNGFEDSNDEIIAEAVSFNDKYSDLLFEQSATRSEILEKEYQEALEEAQAIGADTLAVEEYYSNERISLLESEAQEKEDLEKTYADLLFESSATKTEILKKEYDEAIANAEAIGADTTDIKEYYDNELLYLDKDRVYAENKIESDAQNAKIQLGMDRLASQEALEEKYLDMIFERSATEEELLQKERDKAIANAKDVADSSLADKGILARSILAIEEYYNDEILDAKQDLANEEAEIASDLLASQEDLVKKYEDLLFEQSATKRELLEREYEEAIANAEAIGADREIIDKYYDDQIAILAQESADNQLAIDKALADERIQLNEDIADSLESINNDIYTQQLANEKAQASALRDVQVNAAKEVEAEKLATYLDGLTDIQKAKLKSEGILEETTSERIARELQEAVDAGDIEAQEVLQQEQRINEILQESKDAQLLAEENYQAKLARIELASAVFNKNLAISEAEINKAVTLASIPTDNEQYGALESLFDDLISTLQDTPLPTGFATGGIVLPGSNSSDGGSTVRVAENGSPEVLFNTGAEGQEFINQMGRAIASQLGSNKPQIIINLDGQELADSSAEYYNNGLSELNR